MATNMSVCIRGRVYTISAPWLAVVANPNMI